MARLDSEKTLSSEVLPNSNSLAIGQFPRALTSHAKFAIRHFEIENYSIISANLIVSDLLSDNELRALAKSEEQEFSKYQGKTIPILMEEMYYFAPLEVALRLQRSREYITALDWFQTVYAYHLPHKERKIYARLKMEQNYTPALNRSKHWLLEGLDPHGIAVLRTQR